MQLRNTLDFEKRVISYLLGKFRVDVLPIEIEDETCAHAEISITAVRRDQELSDPAASLSC
jgi:hypothetical protein